MSEPAAAVFLSYASQDAESARRIRDALRAAGVEVWFDQSELRGGDAWDASIRRKIKDCTLFVPLISATTNSRSEGYFRLEWKLAVDRSHLMAEDQPFLLPVVIDDTPEAGARVSEAFRARQWSRLPGGVATAAFCEQVKRLLREATEGQEIPGTAPPATPPPAPPEASTPRPAAAVAARRSWRVPAMAGMVAIAVIAGVLLWKPWGSGPLAPATVAAGPFRTGAAADGESIAVLPFANLSADKENEYFSDGISEEVLNVLARIPGLRVSARTASFPFKGKDLSTIEIARQLGVAYIVEGSVRKSGTQVRINVRLVKGADAFQMWSENFTRDVKDIFAVQDEIAALVAKELKLKLGTGAGMKLTSGATRNPAAYEAFLKGRESSLRPGANSDREAVALLQEAVRLDPEFALAHGALAEAYIQLGNSSAEPRDQAFPLAKAAAERAIALDERVVQAHNALAEYAFHYSWDFEASDRHMRKALAVDPNYFYALSHMASHEQARNRLDSAMDAYRKAREVNPYYRALGIVRVLSAMKRYDEAIKLGREELARHPDGKRTKAELGNVLMLSGRTQEGLQLLEEALAMDADEPVLVANVGWAQARAGQEARARQSLQRLQTLGATRPVPQIFMAQVYAGLGDAASVMSHLERSYELREPFMPFLGALPEFAPYHGDPRFRSLLKKMKLDVYFPEPAAR